MELDLLKSRVEKTIQERNEEDQTDYKTYLLLSLPFCAFTWCTFNLMAYMLCYQFFGHALNAYTFVLVNAIIVGLCWWDMDANGDPEWLHADYYCGAMFGSRAFPGGNSISSSAMSHVTPLHLYAYTPISNPARTGILLILSAPAIASFLLAGPRTVRRAVEARRRIRGRSRPGVANAVAETVAWVHEHQPVSQEELEDWVGNAHERVIGYAVAVDLHAVRRSAIDGYYDVKPGLIRSGSKR